MKEVFMQDIIDAYNECKKNNDEQMKFEKGTYNLDNWD